MARVRRSRMARPLALSPGSSRRSTFDSPAQPDGISVEKRIKSNLSTAWNELSQLSVCRCRMVSFSEQRAGLKSNAPGHAAGEPLNRANLAATFVSFVSFFHSESGVSSCKQRGGKRSDDVRHLKDANQQLWGRNVHVPPQVLPK